MPDTPESRGPETVLAFDFGRRRIGIAVGQQITATASALGTARNQDNGPDWSCIASMISDWRPTRLIVGLPLRPDGSPSELDDDVRTFCLALQRFNLPVESIDERYSSREAGEFLKHQRHEGLRGRIRRETIDAAAAVVIAERWLRRQGQDSGTWQHCQSE